MVFTADPSITYGGRTVGAGATNVNDLIDVDIDEALEFADPFASARTGITGGITGGRGRSYGGRRVLLNARPQVDPMEIDRRVRLIAKFFPDAAEDPGFAYSMASSSQIDDDDGFLDEIASAMGFAGARQQAEQIDQFFAGYEDPASGASWHDLLERKTNAETIINAWDELDPVRQQLLGEMLGYNPNDRLARAEAARDAQGDDNFWDDLRGAVATPFRPLGWLASETGEFFADAGGETLHALDWTARQAGHWYRAGKKVQEEDGNVASAFGMLTFGAWGNFRDAWGDTADGEKYVQQEWREKAQDQVGGDESKYRLARELATTGDPYEVADKYARRAAGIPVDAPTETVSLSKDYIEGYQQTLLALQDEDVQDASVTLNNGKSSFGRGMARIILGPTTEGGEVEVNTNEGVGRVLSGALDATALIALDPFLIGGRGYRGFRYLRHGIRVGEDATPALLRGAERQGVDIIEHLGKRIGRDEFVIDEATGRLTAKAGRTQAKIDRTLSMEDAGVFNRSTGHINRSGWREYVNSMEAQGLTPEERWFKIVIDTFSGDTITAAHRYRLASKILGGRGRRLMSDLARYDQELRKLPQRRLGGGGAIDPDDADAIAAASLQGRQGVLEALANPTTSRLAQSRSMVDQLKKMFDLGAINREAAEAGLGRIPREGDELAEWLGRQVDGYLDDTLEDVPDEWRRLLSEVDPTTGSTLDTRPFEWLRKPIDDFNARELYYQQLENIQFVNTRGISDVDDVFNWLVSADPNHGLAAIIAGRSAQFGYRVFEFPRLSRAGMRRARANLGLDRFADVLTTTPDRFLARLGETGLSREEMWRELPYYQRLYANLANAFGSFHRVATNQVPFRNLIALHDQTGAVDFERFLRLALPERDVYQFYGEFLGAANPATKRQVVQSATKSILERFGVEREFLERWTRNVHGRQQIYSGVRNLDKMRNPLGDVYSSALWPSQVADDFIAIPDFREMVKAASGAGAWKTLFGATHRSVLDAFMGKIWKPAVLMRVGFIPRAAGEELLSFVVRRGFGAPMQHWFLQPLHKYVNKAGQLTRFERELPWFLHPMGLVSRRLTNFNYKRKFAALEELGMAARTGRRGKQIPFNAKEIIIPRYIARTMQYLTKPFVDVSMQRAIFKMSAYNVADSAHMRDITGGMVYDYDDVSARGDLVLNHPDQPKVIRYRRDYGNWTEYQDNDPLALNARDANLHTKQNDPAFVPAARAQAVAVHPDDAQEISALLGGTGDHADGVNRVRRTRQALENADMYDELFEASHLAQTDRRADADAILLDIRDRLGGLGDDARVINDLLDNWYKLNHRQRMALMVDRRPLINSLRGRNVARPRTRKQIIPGEPERVEIIEAEEMVETIRNVREQLPPVPEGHTRLYRGFRADASTVDWEPVVVDGIRDLYLEAKRVETFGALGDKRLIALVPEGQPLPDEVIVGESADDFLIGSMPDGPHEVYVWDFDDAHRVPSVRKDQPTPVSQLDSASIGQTHRKLTGPRTRTDETVPEVLPGHTLAPASAGRWFTSDWAWAMNFTGGRSVLSSQVPALYYMDVPDELAAAWNTTQLSGDDLERAFGAPIWALYGPDFKGLDWEYLVPPEALADAGVVEIGDELNWQDVPDFAVIRDIVLDPEINEVLRTTDLRRLADEDVLDLLGVPQQTPPLLIQRGNFETLSWYDSLTLTPEEFGGLTHEELGSFHRGLSGRRVGLGPQAAEPPDPIVFVRREGQDYSDAIDEVLRAGLAGDQAQLQDAVEAMRALPRRDPDADWGVLDRVQVRVADPEPIPKFTPKRYLRFDRDPSMRVSYDPTNQLQAIFDGEMRSLTYVLDEMDQVRDLRKGDVVAILDPHGSGNDRVLVQLTADPYDPVDLTSRLDVREWASAHNMPVEEARVFFGQGFADRLQIDFRPLDPPDPFSRLRVMVPGDDGEILPRSVMSFAASELNDPVHFDDMLEAAGLQPWVDPTSGNVTRVFDRWTRTAIPIEYWDDGTVDAMEQLFGSDWRSMFPTQSQQGSIGAKTIPERFTIRQLIEGRIEPMKLSEEGARKMQTLLRELNKYRPDLHRVVGVPQQELVTRQIERKIPGRPPRMTAVDVNPIDFDEIARRQDLMARAEGGELQAADDLVDDVLWEADTANANHPAMERMDRLVNTPDGGRVATPNPEGQTPYFTPLFTEEEWHTIMVRGIEEGRLDPENSMLVRRFMEERDIEDLDAYLQGGPISEPGLRPLGQIAWYDPNAAQRQMAELQALLDDPARVGVMGSGNVNTATADARMRWDDPDNMVYPTPDELSLVEPIPDESAIHHAPFTRGTRAPLGRTVANNEDRLRYVQLESDLTLEDRVVLNELIDAKGVPDHLVPVTSWIRNRLGSRAAILTREGKFNRNARWVVPELKASIVDAPQTPEFNRLRGLLDRIEVRDPPQEGITIGKTRDEAMTDLVRRQRDDMRSYAVRTDGRVAYDLATMLGNRQYRGVENLASVDFGPIPARNFGPTYVQHDPNAWERLVRGFFDGVVQPAIESVIRRPMFTESYAAAMAQAEAILVPRMVNRELAAAAFRVMRRNPTKASADELWRMLRPLLADEASTRPLTLKRLANDLIDIDDPTVSDLLSQAVRYDEKGRPVWRLSDKVPEPIRPLVRTYEDTMIRERQLTLGIRDARQAGDYDTAARLREELGVARADAENVEDIVNRDLNTVQRWFNQQDNAYRVSSDVSAERAWNENIRFIDDHRIRSQMGEYVRNLVPFYFAEEQFYKRWVRTLAEAPEGIRRVQLLTNGLRSAGWTREDSYGNEIFVYPGSEALTEVMATVAEKVTGQRYTLPIPLAITGRVRYSLPGFDRLGVPGPGPLVSLPLKFMADRFPELEGLERGVLGERGVNRGVVDQLVPASVSRFAEALLARPESSREMAATMMTAIQYLEAEGHTPPEDASPAAWEEYNDRVQNWTRTFMLAKAAIGFVGPASPQRDLLDSLQPQYRELLQTLPVEEAIAAFIELNPDARPYSVFQSETPSRAPLPPSEEALNWMEEHEGALGAFPMGGPWLIPDYITAADDPYSSKAYYEQIALGLRERKTYDEFLVDLKWASAAPEYFERKDAFDLRIAATDGEERQALKREWRAWADEYLNRHPIFADALQNPEGAQRREAIRADIEEALKTEAFGQRPEYEAISTMMRSWQNYQDERARLRYDNSAAARKRRDNARVQLTAWMEKFIRANPEVLPLYLRVIRPDLGIDQNEYEEIVQATTSQERTSSGTRAFA